MKTFAYNPTDVGFPKASLHGAVIRLRLLSLSLILATIGPPALTPIGLAQENPRPEPVPVRLEKTDAGWQILRGGIPYYVNGGGGEGALELLKASGANSVRTWGVDEATLARLDAAQRQGISVAVGIWLEHERHGFDYSDEAAVKKQFDATIDAVQRFKNHPAVLVWGIGNEMEGEGGNPKIWQHIEELSQAIKAIDPHHPTMTVIAEMGQNKIASIHQYCPSLDIIGINSYGGAASVPQRYRQQGGSKPYLVTEFGPPGPWEVPKNSFGAVVEETSTAKVRFYTQAYDAFVNDKELCLGSYAFLFGHKQEATATWFGLLLPDGNRTAALDALQERWSNKAVANHCPEIVSFELSGPSEVKPGTTVSLKLKTRDRENDPLTVRWSLMSEASSYITGGDFQATPQSFPQAIVTSDHESATIKLPAEEGGYRVYVFVEDAKGGGATANLPLRTRIADLTPGERVELPLVIYGEPNPPGRYAPSGWMGETNALRIDQDCQFEPRKGKSCIECRYLSTSGWGGIVWQHPVEDWGDQPGGFDLREAQSLTFWAKGSEGGEVVKFGFGLLGKDKKYPDSDGSELEIRLTNQWKQYSIDVTSKQMSCIKTGFYWVVAGQSKPLTFYLDEIHYE